MKAEYSNWVPDQMVYGSMGMTGTFLLLFLLFGLPGFLVKGGSTLQLVLGILFGIMVLLGLGASAMFLAWHFAFSYSGKRQMSRQIIEGVARRVDIPKGGRGLDVGCGSGALTIACARRNPGALMIGLDRWGKEYSNFSQKLCENNARAEGTSNTQFIKGDALHLNFPDESFDAVTSNYVYHNISGHNRQEILLESLRVLKKGGIFAIHDLMNKERYGDMEVFRDRLLSMGYQEVVLIDTTKGEFMSPGEARFLFLSGSTLLFGIK